MFYGIFMLGSQMGLLALKILFYIKSVLKAVEQASET